MFKKIALGCGGLFILVIVIITVAMIAKPSTPSKTVSKTYSIQKVTDALSNEVNDNGDPAKSYVKYLDITEADFGFQNNTYTITIKTAGSIPTLSQNQKELNFIADLQNSSENNKSAKDSIMLGVGNTASGYNYTLDSLGNSNIPEYASDNTLHTIQGNYSVSGNTITMSIPMSFLSKIGVNIPVTSVKWKVQTQEEIPAPNTDPALAVDNFVPNNQNDWIQYKQ